MVERRALITGITGQGRIALEDPDHRLSRLQDILARLHLHAASPESYASIYQVVSKWPGCAVTGQQVQGPEARVHCGTPLDFQINRPLEMRASQDCHHDGYDHDFR